MSATHVAALLFWLVAMVSWATSVWGAQAERLYDRVGPEPRTWYWLRLFHVPPTRENCVRFVKRASVAGMFLLTIGVAMILVLEP